MSAAAITFITYVWHYLVARLVYDQLLRPLIHGHASTVLLICGGAFVAFTIAGWSGRRRGRRARAASQTRRGQPDRRRRG